MSSDEENPVETIDKIYEVVKDVRALVIAGIILGTIYIFLTLGILDIYDEMIYDYNANQIQIEERQNHTILAKATKDLCLFEPRFGYKLCDEVWEGRDNSTLDLCKSYSYHGATLSMQDCVSLQIEKYEDGNFDVQEHSITLIPIERITG